MKKTHLKLISENHRHLFHKHGKTSVQTNTTGSILSVQYLPKLYTAVLPTYVCKQISGALILNLEIDLTSPRIDSINFTRRKLAGKSVPRNF
jgi:hypothetical protein